ncbi:methyltransferase domain-containing protein [Altererythrobacter soli]|uniref:Methyltransferase domain-containing protein n=1 Tax=Croceibacterium soli TaxID=1739690 RepID=A0A6I4UPT8_9SPHN|nr:class I SAM-dependent methyltransferase [Croceibacterium soli]MXP40990.1 methyltransferase domain-containing protein [Croceibacterium soli]
MQSGSVTVGADEWLGRTGNSWAAEWRRTDRSFGVLTERLLQRTREYRCASVLDIGCGAGELSLAIARGRPKSRVVGVDISPQLVAVARERGSQLGNATFEEADVAAWKPAEPFAPDMLVSRHGVMFFADPVAAFANLHAVAAPEAGLLFSCFRAWEENPAFADVARLLPVPPPPPAANAPGPFGFSDPARVEAILARSGWTGIAFESFDFPMIVGAGEDPVEDACAYFSTIGPAARALRELDEDRRVAFFANLRDLARRNMQEGLVALRAAAWIVTARRG